MKADFGLAWDHGRRRALLVLSAALLALALVFASIGGSVASTEARSKGVTEGKSSITVIQEPIYQTLGLSWG